MEKETIKLTNEKFQEIFSNPEFRNEVAYAHQCCDKDGKFKHYSTCSYPVRYIVTKAQINEAKGLIEFDKKARQNFIKHNPEVLVFVGMGCTYAPRFEGDLCNHRIRTEFKNMEGHSYFIEVGTGRGQEMRVDHSIDRDLEIEHDSNLERLSKEMEKVKYRSTEWFKLHEAKERWWKQPYNNFANLERGAYGDYTKKNLLRIINNNFNCAFEEIEVDNFTLTTDDFVCESPKLVNA